MTSHPLLRPADHAGIEAAAERLRAGGLVVLPTETVYGLGADASAPDAVRRIFATKGRPADHPLIVHLGDPDELDRWAVEVPDTARKLAAACWPGPLTLVLRRAGGVSDVVTGGLDTVGLRVPAHPVIAAVLRAFGGGVAAPSANRFGRVSPTTAQHVLDELGEVLDPARDLVLDGGPCTIGVESTIVDCTAAVPVILRPGGVPAERIESVLGIAVQRKAGGPSRAPGMLAAHYAPTAQVVVVSASEVAAAAADEPGRRVGVLAPADVAVPPGAVRLDAPAPYSAELLAPLLYARLRQADVLGLDLLLVVAPPAEGLGAAIIDRLTRAATGSAR